MIGANRLILVKHMGSLSGLERCEDLVTMGLVDEAFPQYLRMSSTSASIVGPKEHAAVAAAVRCGASPGFSIK